MAGGRFRVVPREIPPELIFRLTIAGALMVVTVALLSLRSD
jgi:hypothetical protein